MDGQDKGSNTSNMRLKLKNGRSCIKISRLDARRETGTGQLVLRDERGRLMCHSGDAELEVMAASLRIELGRRRQ